MRFFILLAAATSLMACSGSGSNGSSGSTGSTGGTLSGDFAFTPNTTLAWSQPGTSFSGTTIADARSFDITASATTCQSLDTDAGFQPSVGLFDIVASGTVLSASSVVPGHYPDDAGNEVQFYVQVQNSSGIGIFLTSDGTIDVEQVDPDFKGSFSVDLPLDDGGTSNLSGTFDGPYCK